MVAEELFDASQFGHFYVPDNIVRFLIALTTPQPGEKVLGIGVFDPTTLGSTVKTETSVQPTHVKGHATPIELNSLDEQYPVILCAPPFGVTFDQDTAAPGESSEKFWLKWSIGHLGPDGRLAIIVPTGLLSNYSQQAIRRFVLEECDLQAILELPSGWATGTATQGCILFIAPDRQPNRSVRMFRFTSPEIIPWHDLAPHVLAAKPALPKEVSGKAYAVVASELDSIRLDPQYYDPKYSEITALDPDIFEPVRLADLVDIRSGDRFSKRDFQPQGIPFVQVGIVMVDGYLNLRKARTISPDTAVDSRGYARPGDILMTVAGTVGKVAFMGDQTSPTGVCIDTSLRRLRVRNDNRILPEYLALYLRSRLAQLQIERFRSGSVIRTLSSPNLGEIIVYVPVIPKQRELIATFHDAAHQQRIWLLSAFPDVEQMRCISETPQTMETQVVEQTILPLVVSPVLPWQEVVKAQFPFPIARAYTVFEDRASHSPSSRLKALIDVSEAIVYYLYGILVADQLRRLGINDDDLKSKVVTNFSIDRRIIFILHMLKLAKANHNIALFTPELVNAQVGICRDIHNNLRNPYSHVAKPPEPWCDQAIAAYEPKLERLLRSIMSLKDYKLAQVTRLTVRDGRFQHIIASMMGNNTLFQSQEEDLESPVLADTNHVILIDQDYNILDLHPFYLLHAWESTGMYHHLCFFKQVSGDPPNQRLKVESTHGVGDTTTETDLGLGSLLAVF